VIQMNVSSPGLIGMGFVLLFLILMLYFWVFRKDKTTVVLREITAYQKLIRSIHLAVEEGHRVQITLGHGGISEMRGSSALAGLVLLRRVSDVASLSDYPPITTSGEATTAFLSQETMHSAYETMEAERQYDPESGLLTGLTPFSYAAGTMPIVGGDRITTNVLLGHFGNEVGLIMDAAERKGSLIVAGSEDLPAQAITYALANEPLIGEELYVCGAYIQENRVHTASLLTQDLVRWLLILTIIGGVILKLAGVL